MYYQIQKSTYNVNLTENNLKKSSAICVEDYYYYIMELLENPKKLFLSLIKPNRPLVEWITLVKYYRNIHIY